jgi:hypothetical protein
MILELLDGTQIEVKNIFGGPRLIDGVMRDTLRIEVDPDTIAFGVLKSYFKDNPSTALMSTYNDVEEDGEVKSVKSDIGEGYQIFVSITDEERKVTPPPGRLVADTYEEVFIVTMAQLTYQEYTESDSTTSEAVG